MTVSRTLIAALGALSVTAVATLPAVAQDSATAGSRPLSPSSQVMDEIEVRGRRMDEIEFNLRRFVMDFVLEVTALPPGRGFARWQRSVCVGVHNLENTAAQYLVDRISLLAMEVGLEPGEPGCTPQVMIIFTTDADEVATRMVEQDRRLFRPVAGLAGMNLDLEALDAFMRSDKPVRWWHVSLPVDARTGMPAIQTSAADGPPTIAVAGPSRIYSGVRDDLQHVIIIADATRLSGMTWQQLGDYLAVISLAQVDPKANPTAFDSILNLFSTPQYYSGLTDWDRSYVRALYEFDQERNPRLQRGGLVSQMTIRERAADARATATD
jgi:hypothetical protein